ncbi:MAG: tRNA lysidine(34) synthetase TilS [Anaerolineales bacterium]
MNVTEIVSDYIQELHLLEPQETVLVAVSGGSDSLCLLLVLKELGFTVLAAHFDHGLRPESARDAETVQRLAQTLGIDFHVERGDVRQRAKQKRTTLEEAARDLRYDFLLRTAADCQAPAIAIGHTADDQAETVLLHLLRGSGLQGLRGIRPEAFSRGLRIIRPLLRLTHAQTVEYCRQAGWQPLEDPSNQDPSFARNRIRRELIPQLRGYNTQIVPVLCRLTEIAAAQTELLDRATNDFQDRFLLPAEPGMVRIVRDAFNQSQLAVRQAVVRRAVGEIAGTLRDLAYRHVNRVVEFSLAPTASRRMNLALGIDVSIENQSLVLRKREATPTSPEWENLQLPVPGEVSIRRPDWKFHIARRQVSGLPSMDIGKDPWTIQMDTDKIHLPLFLRKREPGDRFFPAGMPGTVRLNDFLAAHHLPHAERDCWPLVCDGNGILWIPGYRLREGAASFGESGDYLEIRVERPMDTVVRGNQDSF